MSPIVVLINDNFIPRQLVDKKLIILSLIIRKKKFGSKIIYKDYDVTLTFDWLMKNDSFQMISRLLNFQRGKKIKSSLEKKNWNTSVGKRKRGFFIDFGRKVSFDDTLLETAH